MSSSILILGTCVLIQIFKQMKNIFKVLILTVLMLITVIGCQKDNVKPVDNTEATTSEISREEIALNLLKIMQNEEAREAIVHTVIENTTAVSLESLMSDVIISSANKNATEKLTDVVLKSAKSTKTSKSKAVEIPEVWMHNPKQDVKSEEVLVSFVPEGKEEDWKEIVAYKLDGTKVMLSADKDPDETILVVETRGYESLKVEVDLMNERLRKENLQSTKRTDLKFAQASDMETTKLDKIIIYDVKEPWILGAAEIYAITSGVRVADVQNEVYAPEISIIPMYYLDDEEKAYYPNQILLFWDDYDFQAANIQLFEKDRNYSWEELIEAVVEGVIDLVGVFTGIPWLSLLSDIAGAILEALPEDWYVNDDDYVDSFYTIEKGKTYNNYFGAARNARVDLKPYILQAN